MIKLVVFDLAGTVLDEQNIVYKTLHRCINESGVSISYEKVIEFGAGKEKSQALRDILNHCSPDPSLSLQGAIFNFFLQELSKEYETLDVKPMRGTEEVFAGLRNKKIYIAFNTGYNRTTAEQLLTKLKWKKQAHYDLVITSSEVSRSRPAPDMIWRAMELFSIKSADKVIKIGDSCADVIEGRNAGCKASIGITTGAQTREELLTSSPDFIIDALSELLPIIKSL
ncbi:MAG: HAD family hydrolase [Chitinophagales bacterium]|nr:HAD family hydrolase [Chitinophagales bacterium]